MEAAVDIEEVTEAVVEAEEKEWIQEAYQEYY